MMETAVKRIGNDLKSQPIAETGSREIRAAAKAVNAMQVRLRDYVEDREHLAAALAHDLRTPLTRMRLRLELLRKSTAREALAHDLADIESIASSVIDFATFEVTEEKSERIDFWSLVEAIADGFEDVSFDGDETRSRGLICIARPVALEALRHQPRPECRYLRQEGASQPATIGKDDHADHPRRGARHTASPARRGVRILSCASSSRATAGPAALASA